MYIVFFMATRTACKENLYKVHYIISEESKPNFNSHFQQLEENFAFSMSGRSGKITLLNIISILLQKSLNNLHLLRNPR